MPEIAFLRKVNHFKARYLKGHQFLYLLAAIVGFGVGLAAVVIKNLVHFTRTSLLQFFQGEHNSFYLFVSPLVGIALVVLFIRYINKRPVGHGIPGVLFAISKNNGIIRRHNLYSSIITSTLTVGFGGSVGLEGPTVATGGAIGSNIGRLFKLSYKETILLVSCACAGAMSAIFKAPIAGIAFAMEVIMIDLTMYATIPLLIASATAAMTSYVFLGQHTLYPFRLMEEFQMAQIHYYLVLGVLVGLLSAYFTRSYIKVSGFFEGFQSPWKRLLFAGGLLGIVLFFFPPLYGEGYDAVNQGLRGEYLHLFEDTFFESWQHSFVLTVLYLLLLIGIKVIATTLTFAAGGIGGIFAPSLFMGANMGLLFGLVLHRMGIDVSISNLALVGMASMIAGVIQAPLTAIFLVAEITGGYQLLFPLLLASTLSFGTVRLFEKNSVYTVQLAKRGELMTHHKDRNILLMMKVTDLIETNFISVNADDSLRDLIKVITQSSRNIYPVVDDDQILKGIVKLDDIRHIMFNQEMYDSTRIRDLMVTPEWTVKSSDQMEEVARVFSESGRYNIPVLEEGKYLGFVSRARVFSSYREMLKHFSDD
ncbi:MAG: chloride channel protein [Bacteroidetes bacterium]|nr:MAG: chloride channel protein [Bacteroidota bacterium]